MTLPSDPFSLIGYAVGFLTVIGTIWRDKRKGDVEETTLVLDKWKQLVEAHEKTLATLNTEIAGLRARLLTAETGLAAANKRITELELENAGLKRAIAQNSQSVAYALGASPQTGMEDMVEALDRAGHNRRNPK